MFLAFFFYRKRHIFFIADISCSVFGAIAIKTPIQLRDTMVIRVRYRYLFVAAAVLLSAAVLFILHGSGEIAAGAAAEVTGTENLAEEGEVVLPIIMYHEIKTFKLGKDVISPYEFESDLKYIREHEYHTITMTELINYVNEGGELPQNPIVLSFDDGYLSTYQYALPLLRQYQMKIVFSVIGRDTDNFSEYPSKNIDYAHVTWDQLREMSESGCVEVQNHTYNLHAYTQSRLGCMQSSGETLSHYEQLLTDDISLLQEKIMAATGTVPNTFTYPYGKSSESTLPIIKSLGFEAVLTCNYGVNIIGDDPEALYKLKRVCRSHDDTLSGLLKAAYKTIKRPANLTKEQLTQNGCMPPMET